MILLLFSLPFVASLSFDNKERKERRRKAVEDRVIRESGRVSRSRAGELNVVRHAMERSGEAGIQQCVCVVREREGKKL